MPASLDAYFRSPAAIDRFWLVLTLNAADLSDRVWSGATAVKLANGLANAALNPVIHAQF